MTGGGDKSGIAPRYTRAPSHAEIFLCAEIFSKGHTPYGNPLCCEQMTQP